MSRSRRGGSPATASATASRAAASATRPRGPGRGPRRGGLAMLVKVLSSLEAAQRRLRLRPPEVLHRGADAGRVAEHRAPLAEVAGLHAQRGVRLLVAGVGYLLRDRVDAAGAALQRQARVAVGGHA